MPTPNRRQRHYRVQNSCRNCFYSFEKIEYEDWPEYFCMWDPRASPRPDCGSVCMKESFTGNGADEWARKYYAWAKWARRWHADVCGICDKWAPIPKKENK